MPLAMHASAPKTRFAPSPTGLLHLGNIVLTPAGELGLIDIADLRASGKPIPRHRRLRNLKHLMRDEQDRAWICHPDATVFDRAYNIALGQGAADRA